MPKYDVAVVGAGLGGLAVAALLSSKKKRIIVIERGSLNEAVGAFARDGYQFSASPALSYGFERGGAFYTLSANLGIVHSVSVKSPCYQVALPDHRITIFADQGETLEELRREFPTEIDSLIPFYRDLHRLADTMVKSRFSAYVTKHRSVAGFIRKYRFSRELTAFFDIQALYFFQRPVAELSLVDLITLCDTPPLYLEGGFKKLAARLYDTILQQGGEILHNETVNEFALRGSTIVGIKTKQDVIEADTILMNLSQRTDSSTIFMGLQDTVMPVGMCPEVLYLPEYRSPRDFFTLSFGADNDGANAPHGMRALSMSFRSAQGGADDKQALIDTLNRLIPFLNDYLVFSEEHRAGDEGIELPQGFTFKPLRSGEGMPLLYRGSKKNIYLLKNEQTAPLQVISEVNRFVQKVS
ncbi:MAG: NAD(P)-binding protein [Nitrospirae bacterium]|nr:NAD(P)-binding protein [Nitrospirota bacterium]